MSVGDINVLLRSNYKASTSASGSFIDGNSHDLHWGVAIAA